MVPISTLIFCSCALGIGWFITNILKNKQIAFEKKLGEMSAQEIRNSFEIYRRTTDLEIRQLKERMESERAKYADFQMKYQTFPNMGFGFHESGNKSASIPPNTIQAVKYAMKHAHPDNGGNAEDFMRFKKCYEELTGK